MNKSIKLVKAIVIDNDDTNFGDSKHLSRIKVRPIPEMDSIDPALLPWVRPWNIKGMTEKSYSHDPPEIGSNVRCYFLDEYWKQGYYIAGDFIDGFFSWENVVEQLQSHIPILNTQIYPNPRFTQLSDGSIVFHNTITGEIGILHNSGTYIVISSTGGVNINALDQVTIEAPVINLIGLVNESVPQKVVNHTSHQENITGLKQENIGGSKTVSIGSSYHETILDEKGEVTTGNRNIVVGGNLTINLPNPTSTIDIKCGLGEIKIDGPSGMVTINGNLQVSV